MADRYRALLYVLRGESAFSLGTAGRKLRAALDALHRWDTHHPGASGPDRTRLVRSAASALSAVVIQREALGLTDHAILSAEYGVVPEVWRSMGIAEGSGGPSPGNR